MPSRPGGEFGCAGRSSTANIPLLVFVPSLLSPLPEAICMTSLYAWYVCLSVRQETRVQQKKTHAYDPESGGFGDHDIPEKKPLFSHREYHGESVLLDPLWGSGLGAVKAARKSCRPYYRQFCALGFLVLQLKDGVLHPAFTHKKAKKQRQDPGRQGTHGVLVLVLVLVVCALETCGKGIG